MRAYMSRRDERDERTANAGTIGDLGVAWNAEREARAILAETEPLAGSHQSLTWLGDWAPEFAESISAFIEQEF